MSFTKFGVMEVVNFLFFNEHLNNFLIIES
jgi:hypothetical protein